MISGTLMPAQRAHCIATSFLESRTSIKSRLPLLLKERASVEEPGTGLGGQAGSPVASCDPPSMSVDNVWLQRVYVYVKSFLVVLWRQFYG